MIVLTTSPQRPFPLKKRLASTDVLTSSSKPAREQDSALQSTTKRWLKAVGLVLVGGRLGNTAEGLEGEKSTHYSISSFSSKLIDWVAILSIGNTTASWQTRIGGWGESYQYGFVRGRWCRAKRRVTATGFAPMKVERVD